ncbi:hypothetical protein PybrP1_009848 [[Pythium] brassicae (nom. inval.)]|nr:hypothetical protein PybrP1_009848 [[Pythium] brassicae (nom. inval.)]
MACSQKRYTWNNPKGSSGQEPNTCPMQRTKSALNKKFTMSDLGEARYLLGWNIVRDRKQRTIHIHQENYANTVLKRFNHLDAQAVSTPTNKSIALTQAMCPSTKQETKEMAKVPYREAV